MWSWIKANASALEAIGVVLTALVALVALVGVKYQVDATAKLQQAQTAREIYREFPAISIQKPELAVADYCEIRNAKQRTAYEHYVEYMLYTAEQVIEMDSDWQAPMSETIRQHSKYICALSDWASYSAPVVRLVNQLREQGYCKRAKCE